MKQIFRRFKTAKIFRGREASVRKGHTSSVVHRYRARKRKHLLIAVGIIVTVVMVPILVSTAAYGDEIFRAQPEPQVIEAAQPSQEPEPTPTPSLAADQGILLENTQGEAPADDSNIETQGGTEEVTPAPEQTPAEAPESTPVPEQTPAVTPEITAAHEQAPAVSPEISPSPVLTPSVTQEITPAPEQTPAVTPESTPVPEPTPAVTPETPVQEQAQAPETVQQAAVPAAQAPVQNEQQKLFTGDILPETTDPLVATIQSRLMSLHYMDEDEPTEFFGPLTKQAIGFFQRKHGLQVTGVATYDTLQALFADNAKPYTVTIGASGTDVEEIQKRLDSLGYDVSATGYFGTDTEGAVKAFQKNNELGIDGNVGYYTKEALYSSDAITASGDKAGSSSSGDSSGGSSSSTLERFIDVLEAQLGKPYVLGAKGPNAFDCSGLIYYALNQAGYDIDYMTSAGWRSADFTTIKSIGDLRRGDIICMSGHVAVYMGDGTVIDASSSQNAMMHRDFGSWFKNGFIHAKRVF